MASVTPEAFVVCSGVRSGFKREFAFVLKAQAEMSMSPTSRTRSGKVRHSSAASSREPAAKRRRKSEAADAPPSTASASPTEECLILPVPAPGAAASLEMPPVAEASVAVDAVSKEVEVGVPSAALPSIQIDGSVVDSFVPIQIQSGSAVGMIRSTKSEEGVEMADIVPSIQVDVKAVTEMPHTILTEAESMMDTVSPIHVEVRPVMEIPLTIQTEAESKTDIVPSLWVHAKPVMEMPQTVQTEVESVKDMAPSVQVDAKPVIDMPQTIQMEAQNVTDTAPLVQVEARPVVEMPQTVQNEAETMLDMIPSVQADAKPGMEMLQAIPIKVESTMDMVASDQVEVRSVMDIPAADIDNRISQKTEECDMLAKPMRRFTRSLLRPPVEESQPSTVEESSPVLMSDDSPGGSGGPDGLEEIKDSSSSMNGLHEPLSMAPKKKMELKMSKKITSSKFPSSIRGLLATGLLEGLTVKYGFGKREGIRGMIKNGGILCLCASCKGSNIISPYHFELHAGSRKKNPSHFIYLENGNTIYDILRACSSAPLDTLESTLQNAISSEGSKPVSYDICKDSSVKLHLGKSESMSDPCLEAKSSPTSPNLSQESTSTVRCSRPIFSPQSFDCTSRSISSHKNSRGRMTQKDLRLHKLVFTDGILPNGTEVAYYSRGQRVLEGYIKNSGIFCHCCNTVISPSQFEAHAGFPSRRKPYLNIYTSNGVSLHELSITLSKDKRLSANESDDLCRICADGGDLLLCDLCPRAFHRECIGLTSVPKGDWYCPCCQSLHLKDRAVEHNKNAIAAGRVIGVDPIEQIFKRCIRIVKMPEADVGGCVLCRCHDFRTGFGPRTVLLCDQCEREFHVGCLKEHNMGDLKELPEDKWFCSSDCGQIHAALQNLLASGQQQLPLFHSDVIKKKHEQKGLVKEIDLDVRWRLLSGRTASTETGLFLSQALSIFHESFGRIIDFATNKDFIPAMVYGGELRDQDFRGMYCAVLTVNSLVVSAAILRVLGCEVAELPLVATSGESQGKGYFQSLFSCIERMLDSLNVKHLVLPAADEAESIWTNKFGFSKISLDQTPEYMKGFHMMVFEGTSTLHKLVPKSVADVW